MRPAVALFTLLAGVLSACALTTSKAPRLSYAPPSAEPGVQPDAAYAGQPAGLIWNQLLDRLIQSPLEVDLADPERGIVVARYSGNPEPYVSCGYILVQRGDRLEQVPASGQATFNRVVQGRRVEVSRGMRLDARLVVQVEPEDPGAAVNTTSNYVVTKTVEAGGGGRAREVVSFGAGGRGEFSKGTVCQPNGALERIVLDVLPRTARVQLAESGEPAPQVGAADSGGPAPSEDIIESAMPAPSAPPAARVEPATTTRTAENPEPGALGQTAESGGAAAIARSAESDGPGLVGQAAVAPSEAPDTEVAEGAQTEKSAVANLEDGAVSLGCPIADKVFCDVLDITDPYRRANQDRNLGLELEAIEGGSPLLGGGDLGFDVSLPSYDAYLTVSFFLKDGTVRHVLSGWDRRWPAHAREFVSDAGMSLEDGGNVEMVVALASDVPVFASPRPPAETAEAYLSDLRRRLSELSNGGAPAQIAASLLVVTPA